MSFVIHRAYERGLAKHGWLHSQFSFSFAEYYNEDRMGFGALRVINDDVIKAGMGFGMHPHRDMEIISIVTKGSLEHRDSEGHHGVIHAGEIQYMSAGTGVFHSEFATPHEDTELFQIWIHPNRKGYNPVYQQHKLSLIQQKNQWETIVSGDEKDEHSIVIRQDANIYLTHLDKEMKIMIASTKASHGRLILVVEGSVDIAGHILDARDEMQIIDDKEDYSMVALQDSKVLLFDVPMHP